MEIEAGIDIVAEIKRLKKEKNAVILAHYYQDGAIQDVADYVGDSLGLSQEAAKTDADIIVFAGVHFMAETAKILNPNKKVVLPDLNAGCSLADGCPPKEFAAFKAQYPDHIVITYINCSAEIKALSDLVCTSSNAEKIVASIPEDQPIIFAPDKNLGAYIQKITGRENIVLWDGACIVHEAFSMEKLMKIMQKNPKAKLIAHPESEAHILKVAEFIGSTTQLLKYAQENPADEFIVGTEAGILHQMAQDVPSKKLIPLPSKEDNTCACSECHFMKVNTLDKLYNCLKDEIPAIEVPEEIRIEALKPIERMLELSK